jgi:hypothetical protein
MYVRRDRGPLLILASLRGFCLFIFFDTLADYLPAGRQVGKIYPPSEEKPLGTSTPPGSGAFRQKCMDKAG